MKTKILMALSVIVFTVTNCKKENKNSQNVNPIETTKIINEDYGISVESGRLKFSSFESFSKYATSNGNEHKKLIASIEKLAGFTSKKKQTINTSNASKTINDCDCSTDDDYVNEIVDADYMVEIENWIVKINVCNEKFYALDRIGLPASDLSVKIEQMKYCSITPADFAAGTHLYEYDFDLEILDELRMQRFIINGEVVPEALSLCKETASDDRDDWVWRSNHIWTQTMPPGFQGPPQTYDIWTPKLHLCYNKGIINGKTMVYLSTEDIPAWQFELEFDGTSYEEKCGDWHYRNAGVQSIDVWNNYTNIGGYLNYYFVEYHNKRLRSGSGNVKVRVRSYVHPNIVVSPWAEIVF